MTYSCRTMQQEGREEMDSEESSCYELVCGADKAFVMLEVDSSPAWASRQRAPW